MSSNVVHSRRKFLLAGVAAISVLEAETLAEVCRSTEDSVLGPFYRRGAPWRTQLCARDEPGEPLLITGTVSGADSCRPLRGAIVDVWQADAAGHYDNEDGRRAPRRFRLRGRMKTDARGRYGFETILPANYSDGGSFRAKHIHYIVSCPGYESLTTQCYFEGDEYNATDALVKSSLIIETANYLHPSNNRKYLRGTFDVVLTKA